MQKYLVVGCGGSGAKTQAYMMDQLKAHMRQVDPERSTLPAAWQFVSIDVPLVPEAGPDGLPNVAQAGGAYIDIGSRLHYNDFEQGLTEQLGASGALGEIATWATRNPEDLNTPISDGAGQYRGIGRILTIQNFAKIQRELTAAIDRLNLVSTNQELNDLNYAITGKHSDSSDDQPVTIIIGSMAGGSGASMVFDVARLLSTLGSVKPAHTAIFMLTPEVFEAIPRDKMVGSWPNALAMFGEAFAAQTGAGADHDRALYSAMGLPGAPQDSTFARLFPIGARMGGQRARFGDGTPNAIYRGLARALAALVSSQTASSDFKSYALANTGSTAGNRSVLGWGNPSKVAWDKVPWGSLGYAQLSMGRDRYAEYCAQRLARAAFDRLRRGHIDPADPATGKEQLDRRVADVLADVLGNCSLPQRLDRGMGAEDTEQWLARTFTTRYARPAATHATRQVRDVLPAGDGMKSTEWAALVRTRLADLARPVDTALADNAYAAVHAFADFLADAVVEQMETVLSTTGVPCASEALDRVTALVNEELLPAVQAFADSRRGMNPTAIGPQVQAQLQPLSGRGTIASSAQLADAIAAAYQDQFEDYHLGQVAAQLVPVLEDLRPELLAPLRREFDALHADLARAAAVQDVHVNLADVATDEPNAWPADTDEQINRRFVGSANEIVVSDTSRFAADYEDHLIATMRAEHPDLRSLDEAVDRAAREVIAGQWHTQGARRAPHDTLCPPPGDITVGNRSGWVSKHLVASPINEDKREARPARFSARLRPRDLMERTRAWIARPDQPFDRFISVDLRSYLSPSTASNEAEHDARVTRLRGAFVQAMRLARPLAAVDTATLGLAHGVSAEEYHFNFSEIPLAGLNAATDLRDVIVADKYRDEATLTTFDNACTDDRKVFSIDVFGSYPNYSPVVFSSLFPHIMEDWSTRGELTEGFWNLRRARPLPAALPLTDDARRAMVAGWIVGMITGRITIVDEGTPTAAAHIYDPAATPSGGQWVSFPPQLLTPPSRFQARFDWMPAIIESVLLAYADVQTAPVGGRVGDSLRPYILLRSLYDDNPREPTTGAIEHSATRLLAQWLRTGEDPRFSTGSPLGATLEQRRDAARQALQTARDNAAHFRAGAAAAALPGQEEQARPWAQVRDRRYASKMPLYRDLADDVFGMATDLLGRLDRAADLATRPEQAPGVPGSFAVDPGGPDGVDFGGGLF
ncbi:tubulin-like doman-containing protein [Corynebacterium sp. TAE3-ERU12]|uniref:tubulin-like doman-containing protein n=1 Tax=Corynebacterium sp. TAE3-ERU12 TaxID=2849491 RepID=UPI001C448359|nr:tubulin-like doman-containing protein [Corynebacterium sp. TAE3-ERU12]